MLLPTGAIAFTVVAYQSTKNGCRPCSRFNQQSISCCCCHRSSISLTSIKSDSEHDSIDDTYLLAPARHDDNNVNATTSSSKASVTQSLTKRRQSNNIFKRRRRKSLPCTTITDRSNINQHIINLLYRLGRESCVLTTLLLLLYRVVLTTTTPSHLSLRKFITTNLTRWVAASLSVKLLTLHSQIITAVVDESHANMDEDWFLKGEFHVHFHNNTAHDDDYLLTTSTNTSGHNTTAITTTSNNDDTLVRIRQVPSDGSCLFHAIGARLLHEEWMHQATERQHEHPHMSSIMEYSSKLRQQAVNALQDNPQRQFTIMRDENEEPITASSLVQLASDPYGISSDDYLTSMRDESVWGGGPEIIALASELKRQIVVLEPDESVDAGSSDVCFLKVRARFGDAECNYGSDTIYILCANQQFPQSLGRGRGNCNHFLAVFALVSD